jgi:CelD/BcsL family acetyltransferase involved in cellulose biosynthesis
VNRTEMLPRTSPPAARPDRAESQVLRSLAELEAAIDVGLAAEWAALEAGAPAGAFFQSVAWCRSWYRAYSDHYRPVVLIVRDGSELVGIVPLATPHDVPRLVFAGDNMADYRDVLAAPGTERSVVGALLDLFRSGEFAGELVIGPTEPMSPTTSIVAELCRARGDLWAIGRRHPCRRWSGDANVLRGKKTVRNRANYFARQGTVRVERLRTLAEWAPFRTDFFDHHGLRQIQVGRLVTFDSERKRGFYEAILRDYPESTHATVLTVGGRLVAGHLGFVSRGTILWAVPMFDVWETRNSPGQVLLLSMMESATALGFNSIDFTLGTEDYKTRFGDTALELPTVEVYANRTRFLVRTARDRAVTTAKTVAQRRSAATWGRLVDAADEITRIARRARALGSRRVLARASTRAARVLRTDVEGLVFRGSPETMVGVEPRLETGWTLDYRVDRPEDLLRWHGDDEQTAWEIRAAVAICGTAAATGRSLHTLLVGGRLASWIWSYEPSGPITLTETGTSFATLPHSISLYAACTVPEFRGRKLYPALLSRIQARAYKEGTQWAYIMCVSTNVASWRGIEAAGMRLIERHRMRRRLRMARSVVESVDRVPPHAV